MKKETKKYIYFGVTAYLLFLIFTFPASRAWLLVRSNGLVAADVVQLAGISGSWWSGRASQAIIRGRQLYELSWSMKPLGLLTGKLKADVDFKPPEGTFSGVVGMGTDTVVVSDVKARIPLQLANQTLSAFGLQLGGSMNADFECLRFEEKMLTAAEGTLVWQDARISVPQELLLGDIRADLTNEEEQVMVRFADTGGPLIAEGVCSIKPDGSYTFNARLGVREGSQPELVDAVKVLGETGSDGKVTLNFSGKLPKL